MQLTDFDYELPNALVARYPASTRTSSRLMHVNKSRKACEHRHFGDIIDFIEPGDCLVLNNSKVIPARLFGHKASGGQVEIFIERLLSENTALAMLRASKAPKPGTRINLTDKISAEVLGREGMFFELRFHAGKSLLAVLDQLGEIPIPPYLARPAELSDRERYQTVYADPAGSVAAPTAGLHFDDKLLQALRDKGVQIAFVTCHVGAGTFQPVKVEDIVQHKMHQEMVEVSAAVCDTVRATKAAGKRIIAVGTTAVRCLETAASDGALQPYCGMTDIFIYPGYQFHTVDALLTNFHLPKSSLIMLVAAFAGYELTMQAYQLAVDEQYRFFSYGDAMLITS